MTRLLSACDETNGDKCPLSRTERFPRLTKGGPVIPTCPRWGNRGPDENRPVVRQPPLSLPEGEGRTVGSLIVDSILVIVTACIPQARERLIARRCGEWRMGLTPTRCVRSAEDARSDGSLYR